MEEKANEMKNVSEEGSVGQGAGLRVTLEDLEGLDEEFDHPEDCDPDDQSDIVDKAIDGVISTLVNAGYEDDSAVEATFDAMEALLELGQIEDTPDLDVAEEQKNLWIKNSIPKIKEKLHDMGLEF